jgi:hypothetical protein
MAVKWSDLTSFGPLNPYRYPYKWTPIADFSHVQ